MPRVAQSSNLSGKEQRAQSLKGKEQREREKSACCMAVTFVKTVRVIDPSTSRQTIAVLPAAFMRRHRTGYALEIHQPTMTTLLFVLVPMSSVPQGYRYELVKHAVSTRVSVPRQFLQNSVFSEEAKLEIWESTGHPDRLLFRVAHTTLHTPTPDEFWFPGEMELTKRSPKLPICGDSC
jgi:hypothetical protein